MGKIKQGILGAFSGKVGGVVGSSWKGIAVMKTLPASVANPKSSGQVAQRTKMTNAVAFARIILASVIKPLWDRFASGMSGFNAFIAENIDLFAGALPDPLDSLVISSGKMAATDVMISSAATGGLTVNLSWDNDSGEGYKLATDEAYAVVVNSDRDDVSFAAATATRADGTIEVTMNDAIQSGDTINAYLAFRRADGTVVSQTSFDYQSV